MNALTLNESGKTPTMPGIVIMADWCSTGIWDYATGRNLGYEQIPQLSEHEISLLDLYILMYEKWPWDSEEDAEVQSAKNGYTLAVFLKYKHPELDIYFYNYKNVVEGLEKRDDFKNKIELQLGVNNVKH